MKLLWLLRNRVRGASPRAIELFAARERLNRIDKLCPSETSLLQTINLLLADEGWGRIGGPLRQPLPQYLGGPDKEGQEPAREASVTEALLRGMPLVDDWFSRHLRRIRKGTAITFEEGGLHTRTIDLKAKCSWRLEEALVRDAVLLSHLQSTKPEHIFYGVQSPWWTHREEDLCLLVPEQVGGHQIPCDPAGGILLQADDSGAWLKAAIADPKHYGRHGLDTFMAAHAQNCVFRERPGDSICFPSWDEYNELINRRLGMAG